jgi:transcriptional regulator with XRE-family HTH domain
MRRPLSEAKPDFPRDRFAANVKELRARRAMTQEQLAHLTGLSRDEISKLENRLREPRAETIVRLAKGLDVELGPLFEGIEL